MSKLKKGALLLVFGALFGPGSWGEAQGGNSVLTTKHNLSVSGPGEIKAVSEERVCIFCHTPHHANPSTPLWSRDTSSSEYDLYDSTTLVAKPGQPSGSARLCLSCHDGTIALGALYGSDRNINVISMAGGFVKLPAARSSNLGGPLGRDLANDHPISFPYTSELAQLNGQLNLPASLPSGIRLEQGNMLQCTACHNPHKNPYGKFLVTDNSRSQLCVYCHNIAGFLASRHATAPSMAAGCTLCHATHNAGGKKRLLAYAAEEENCYRCHSDQGGAKDVKGPAAKFYSHPMSATIGVHDPKEDPLTAEKHVECSDCHNPHKVVATAASAPVAPGVHLGVGGVSSSGEVLPGDAVNQYQICFRCHADNNFSGNQTMVRQIQEVNTRLDFDSANPSYHPVVAIGKGTSVPSLRTSLSTASMIYCTDCHGNDDPTQARGPHGSNFKYLLAARYETDSYPLSYSEDNYALCYRCHDQLVLLDPLKSSFAPHARHVVDNKVPCSVCHDPHGVAATRGASTSANAHLINFDVRFVAVGGSYNSAGRSCSVSCHASNPHLY